MGWAHQPLHSSPWLLGVPPVRTLSNGRHRSWSRAAGDEPGQKAMSPAVCRLLISAAQKMR